MTRKSVCKERDRSVCKERDRSVRDLPEHLALSGHRFQGLGCDDLLQTLMLAAWF